MKTASGLHFKTYILIFFMVIFGPLGNVLLAKGMKGAGAAGIHNAKGMMALAAMAIRSGTIWLGIGSLLTFFVAYMLVLSWADYSFVQPASAAAYGVVALMGYLFLGEAIAPMRWAGVAVICLGVFVVSGTPPRTTEHADEPATGHN
jgi:uncharacterized membrane protein